MASIASRIRCFEDCPKSTPRPMTQIFTKVALFTQLPGSTEIAVFKLRFPPLKDVVVSLSPISFVLLIQLLPCISCGLDALCRRVKIRFDGYDKIIHPRMFLRICVARDAHQSSHLSVLYRFSFFVCPPHECVSIGKCYKSNVVCVHDSVRVLRHCARTRVLSTWKFAYALQVLDKADLTNTRANLQPFTILIEVRDQNNVTTAMQLQTGTLNPSSSGHIGISWQPEEPGEYTLKAMVLSDLKQPELLSPVVVKTATVEP